MNGRIALEPDICNGKPTVRGTRISVQTVLGHLAAGDDIAEVLEGYPRLTREDVLACLEFAAELAGEIRQGSEHASPGAGQSAER